MVCVLCASPGTIADAKTKLFHNRIGYEPVILALHALEDLFYEICVGHSLCHAISLTPFRNCGFQTAPLPARMSSTVATYSAECAALPPGTLTISPEIAATFHIGLISDKNCGGKDELSNLRTLCSTCNQGAKNITTEKPSAIWLLSQVRRAGQEEQRAVLDWLLKKFKE